MTIKLECQKCGRLWSTEGHYIRHRTGTVSFVVYNADRQCLSCARESPPEPRQSGIPLKDANPHTKGQACEQCGGGLCEYWDDDPL